MKKYFLGLIILSFSSLTVNSQILYEKYKHVLTTEMESNRLLLTQPGYNQILLNKQKIDPGLVWVQMKYMSSTNLEEKTAIIQYGDYVYTTMTSYSKIRKYHLLTKAKASIEKDVVQKTYDLIKPDIKNHPLIYEEPEIAFDDLNRINYCRYIYFSRNSDEIYDENKNYAELTRSYFDQFVMDEFQKLSNFIFSGKQLSVEDLSDFIRYELILNVLNKKETSEDYFDESYYKFERLMFRKPGTDGSENQNTSYFENILKYYAKISVNSHPSFQSSSFDYVVRSGIKVGNNNYVSNFLIENPAVDFNNFKSTSLFAGVRLNMLNSLNSAFENGYVDVGLSISVMENNYISGVINNQIKVANIKINGINYQSLITIERENYKIDFPKYLLGGEFLFFIEPVRFFKDLRLELGGGVNFYYRVTTLSYDLKARVKSTSNLYDYMYTENINHDVQTFDYYLDFKLRSSYYKNDNWLINFDFSLKHQSFSLILVI